MKLQKLSCLLLGVCMTALLSVSSAFAAGTPYSEAEFAKLNDAGQPVVLDFFASWCPTCREQAKAFDTIMKDRKLSAVTILDVDFDNSDDLQKKYGVHQQSTLILFKDKKELARSSGVTDTAALKAFLMKGL